MEGILGVIKTVEEGGCVWVDSIRYGPFCITHNETHPCRVYWGSHGCQLTRGHTEPHECDCCECEHHDETSLERFGCVAKPPYYGAITRFYGEDAGDTDLNREIAQTSLLASSSDSQSDTTDRS